MPPFSHFIRFFQETFRPVGMDSPPSMRLIMSRETPHFRHRPNMLSPQPSESLLNASAAVRVHDCGYFFRNSGLSMTAAMVSTVR